jgi:hypothetical protein
MADASSQLLLLLLNYNITKRPKFTYSNTTNAKINIKALYNASAIAVSAMMHCVYLFLLLKVS